MKLRFDCPQCGGDLDIDLMSINKYNHVTCSFCGTESEAQIPEVIRTDDLIIEQLDEEI